MKPEQQIKALAELDGLVYDNESPYTSLVWRRGAVYQNLPDYLTSYDAIIPLIQKQTMEIQVEVCMNQKHTVVFNATPRTTLRSVAPRNGKVGGINL
jgi:hypothetical protein